MELSQLIQKINNSDNPSKELGNLIKEILEDSAFLVENINAERPILANKIRDIKLRYGL